jgi:menaquinone-dependent protoporphyrinogen IX oxidase
MSAAAGAAAGGILGGVTAAFSIGETNDALAAEAKYNIQLFQMQETLSNFAQENNQIRANEISAQIAQEARAAGEEVTVAERKAIGEETIRRGEGLTAGASVVRSVDAVIQQGNKAKAQVSTQAEAAFVNTQSAARRANAQEQATKLNAYNSMLIKNAQLAEAQVSGVGAFLGIASSALGGAGSGAQLGAATAG